jgi:hypothetical protein
MNFPGTMKIHLRERIPELVLTIDRRIRITKLENIRTT